MQISSTTAERLFRLTAVFNILRLQSWVFVTATFNTSGREGRARGEVRGCRAMAALPDAEFPGALHFVIIKETASQGYLQHEPYYGVDGLEFV